MKNTLINAVIRSNIIHLYNRYTKDKAVIFMLHRFRDPSIGYILDNDAVSADLLERCFSYLRNNDYAVLSLKEVIKKITNDQKLYKTVCFTVDDGYIDFKNIAFPICRTYNIPITIFITTGFIDGNIMMWWDKIEYLVRNTAKKNLEASLPAPTNQITVPLRSGQDKVNAVQLLTNSLKYLSHDVLLAFIEDLSINLEVPLPQSVPSEYAAMTWQDVQTLQSQKINFEPHTLTHPILSRLTVPAQQQQISGSIRAIKNRLGTAPSIFCYPNGTVKDFTQETVDLVKSNGMLAACSTEPGFLNSSLQEQQYRIPRIPFPRHFEQFVLYISGYKMHKNIFSNKNK